MLCLTSLSLTAFRNHPSFSFAPVTQGVFLTGGNGVGKTNILEAISLLVPGRGIRGALPTALSSTFCPDIPWSVSGSFSQSLPHAPSPLPFVVGTGVPSTDDTKRYFSLNHAPVKNQDFLFRHLPMVVYTPQMDGLFLHASGDRRQFLDRMITVFDSNHRGRLLSYEKAVRERNRLLSMDADSQWLDAVEAQIVARGVAIAAHRIDFIARLNAVCASYSFGFPPISITLAGAIEDWLHTHDSLQVETFFSHALYNARSDDARTSSTSIGVHRTDMIVYHARKNMLGAHCSTGEQKILLLCLLLAFKELLRAHLGIAPLSLWDEVFVHLDTTHTQALIQHLFSASSQVWFTGISPIAMGDYGDKTTFYPVSSPLDNF